MSPHSGRMIVAQQFTAVMRSGRIVVREADGWNGSRQIDALFSRPFHGLHLASLPSSDESLGYFQSSAKRGLGRSTFVYRCSQLLRCLVFWGVVDSITVRKSATEE
jgi:hypothetical protein